MQILFILFIMAAHIAENDVFFATFKRPITYKAERWSFDYTGHSIKELSNFLTGENWEVCVSDIFARNVPERYPGGEVRYILHKEQPWERAFIPEVAYTSRRELIHDFEQFLPEDITAAVEYEKSDFIGCSYLRITLKEGQKILLPADLAERLGVEKKNLSPSYVLEGGVNEFLVSDDLDRHNHVQIRTTFAGQIAGNEGIENSLGTFDLSKKHLRPNPHDYFCVLGHACLHNFNISFIWEETGEVINKLDLPDFVLTLKFRKIK